MPFTIVRQDITKMKVDAIVNAANTQLQGGGGACGAIFAAAGAQELQAACDGLAPIKMGEAVITPGFRLPAKFVIHAAGPVYRADDEERSEELLRACYVNSLDIAVANGCVSIAFPLISSGLFGYPKDKALTVAISAIRAWLQSAPDDLEVSLVVFDREAFCVSEELLGAVESYIDEHYVDARRLRGDHTLLPVEYEALRRADTIVFEQAASEVAENIGAEAAPKKSARDFLPKVMPAPSMGRRKPNAKELEAVIKHLDEPFSEMLLRLIDAKGLTDVEVYKRANLDRKLFSKIRTGNGYMPSKRTALALAVALELSLEEVGDLLKHAGYALSDSQIFDVIIEYFIVNRAYDLCLINEVLFKYDQPLLGG